MNYEIKYSDRRTVSLSVKDGQLVVRAPFGADSKRIEKIVASHEEWIKKNIEKQRKRAERFPVLTEEEIAALKKKAKVVLSQKTEHFSKIMGLKYGRITVTSAKTRFGSCSSKGNIAYSYRLILYPEAAIDYVVVHELCHLKEMNHSGRFYSLVEKVLPDYKERIKLLK